MVKAIRIIKDTGLIIAGSGSVILVVCGTIWVLIALWTWAITRYLIYTEDQRVSYLIESLIGWGAYYIVAGLLIAVIASTIEGGIEKRRHNAAIARRGRTNGR